jgi:putative membrane protein
LDLLVPFILAMALSVLMASKLILFLYTEYTSSFEVFLAVTMILISILLLKDLNYSSPSVLITYLTIGISFGFLLEMIPDINPEPMLALIAIFGFIAFSFFLIPGISGSAILLSLGAYKLVISSIANLDLAILIPFASGCLLSLLIMPKLILFLMTNYKNNTISLFSGLIFISGALLLI